MDWGIVRCEVRNNFQLSTLNLKSQFAKIVANFSQKFNPHLDFFDLSSGVLQKNLIFHS